MKSEESETWKPPNYPYQIFLLWKFDIDYWHLSRLFGLCNGLWQLPSIQFIGRGFYRYHNYSPFMGNPHKANIKQAVQLEWEYSSFLIDRGNDLQSGKMVDAHLTLWGWQFSCTFLQFLFHLSTVSTLNHFCWEVLGRSKQHLALWPIPVSRV